MKNILLIVSILIILFTTSCISEKKETKQNETEEVSIDKNEKEIFMRSYIAPIIIGVIVGFIIAGGIIFFR